MLQSILEVSVIFMGKSYEITYEKNCPCFYDDIVGVHDDFWLLGFK